MTSTSSSPLSVFDGTGIKFPKQRRAMLDLASSTNNKSDRNGCLGAVLSLGEFTDILHVQQDALHVAAVLTAIQANLPAPTQTLTGFFQHLQHPGVRPTPAIPHTADSISAYKINLSLWDYNMNRYNEYLEADQQIKDAYIASLDPVSKIQLDDGVNGFRNLTAAMILAHLDSRFHVPTAADLQANRAILSIPFRSDQDFLLFIQSFVEVQIYAERASHPIDSAEMVALFKQAIAPCGLFNQKMYLYFATHPTVLSQTFDSLSKSMAHEWINEILPGRATVTVSSFAASGATVPASPALTLQEQIALAVTAAMKTYNLTPAVATKPAAATKSAVAKKPATFMHYCSTHGFGSNHSSADCRQPGPNHNELATASNTLGGCQTTFVPWNYKLGRRAPRA
jgi:hypothetical protein